METVIGTLVGIVLGWAGNWWFAKDSKRQHAELMQEFAMVKASLAQQGLQVEEQRDPAGKLLAARVVEITSTVDAQPAVTFGMQVIPRPGSSGDGSEPAEPV